MKIILFSAGLLLIAAGCAQINRPTQYPQGYMTSAQAQSDQLKRKMAFGYQGNAECNKELRESIIGEQVAKSILIISEDQPNKYDLFSSKSKLNEAQKKTLKTYLTEGEKCRKILLESSSGTPFSTQIIKRNSELDSIYVKLLSNQITVGEANLAREKLRIRNQEEMAAIDKSVGDSFQNSHNAEVANAERKRAEEVRAYQQQQLINQNQQIITNQIIRDMQPKVAPTVNTNCTRIGNSVNCTSN